MARVELAPEVLDDFDRIVDHLTTFEAGRVVERIAGILDAVQILAHSPCIGRPVSGGLRELVIGSGSQRFVALYRFAAAVDTVFVLAVRSQRESVYKRPA